MLKRIQTPNVTRSCFPPVGLRPARLFRLALLLSGLSFWCPAGAANAGDWPQILGPNRNGVAIDEHLPGQLEGAPQIGWTVQAGQGYAGPAVARDRVLLFHRTDESQKIDAFDRHSGDLVWSTKLPTAYAGGVNPDQGPRCVPLVAEGRVYLFGAAGIAHAVDLNNGKLLWSQDLYDEFRGKEGYFGAGSTPLLIGDRLLFNIGGSPNAGIVALDAKSGKVAWNSTSEGASYSSPVAIRLADRDFAFFITRLGALVVDPKTGSVQAQRRFGARGPTVNAAAPLAIGGKVLLTASYGVGAALVDPATRNLQATWENDDTISSQYNTPLHVAGSIFGIHGREDIGSAMLRCIDARTGAIQWSKSQFGVAHLIQAGDRALALHVDGRLSMFDLKTDAFQGRGEYQLPVGTTRALPALSDGWVYIKSERKLLAVRLR